jgi:hypothetical protein
LTTARSLLVLAAAALCACGPVGATSVIADAEVAVARAHAAEGEKYAIYETTAADLYLQKAREEQGHAQYSTAMELARHSVDLAQAATRRAVDAKKDPSAAPAPPATIARPPSGVSPMVTPPKQPLIVPRPGDATPPEAPLPLPPPPEVAPSPPAVTPPPPMVAPPPQQPDAAPPTSPAPPPPDAAPPPSPPPTPEKQ